MGKSISSNVGWPSGLTMQPRAPKGQGSLFNMGCTKAEGFGAAAWRRQLRACSGGSRAGQLGAWGDQGHGKFGLEEELMDPTAIDTSQYKGVQRQPRWQGQGARVGRLSELMEVSEERNDGTMKEAVSKNSAIDTQERRSP
eukprot:715505-Pelagomonas_calceolata.AAC.1